jgi:hypothetical protein
MHRKAVAAEPGQEDLERPGPAVGHRTQIRRIETRSLEATADRRGDLGRPEPAVEPGGGDEDLHGAPSCQGWSRS